MLKLLCVCQTFSSDSNMCNANNVKQFTASMWRIHPRLTGNLDLLRSDTGNTESKLSRFLGANIHICRLSNATVSWWLQKHTLLNDVHDRAAHGITSSHAKKTWNVRKQEARRKSSRKNAESYVCPTVNVTLLSSVFFSWQWQHMTVPKGVEA